MMLRGFCFIPQNVVGYVVAGFLPLLTAQGLFAQDGPTLQYNRDVRVILADNCFSCHGPDSAGRKADLRLDQREAAIDMGSLTPGDPDASEMIVRIESDDPDLVMPPAETKKTLTAEQKEILRRWVAEGAEYEAHWSFIPPQLPDSPQVANQQWSKNEIDRFVLATLEEKQLAPAPEAEPAKLFRRLHLDITGLPPSPADVQAFVADYSQRKDVALSQWIDQLMDSPAWGEHRARYWLDAARYGDTHGLHFDNYREMWPYRDWVIRAFNANLPFDQMTVEQLAGDLLPNSTIDQRIATGFQRCNITTNEGGTIDEENLANYAVDRVQTFGWVYLGLTTNCCQCHNHKFDPLTMKDFYSLAAYFRNTTQPAKDGNVKDGRGPALVVPQGQDLVRWKALPDEIAAAAAKRDQRKLDADQAFQTWLAAASAETLETQLPTQGLVASVPLNEGSGNTARDECGAAYIHKATGDVTWMPGGKLGSAPVMQLGGTFELGAVGDFERNETFSYGAWIKAGKDNISGAIIARMDEGNAYRGYDLWQQGRSIAVHIIDQWPENALKVVTTDAVLTPGSWQHVFATYDGSGKPEGIKIYVDGKAVSLRTETNSLKSDASIRTETPFRIGQRSHGQVFEAGSLQDVRIYDRLLTDAEMKTLSDLVPLKSVLATAPADRTAQQIASLFDHYLVTQDAEYGSLEDAVRNLQAEQNAIRSRSPVTHVQEERTDRMPMAHVLTRGEYDKPTDQVTATTPAALHPLPDDAPQNRLGLAQWVVDPANPLTARVTVNRFWQQVFGKGIVVTPEDFGVMGATPTHPELLDWLAVDFRDNGWDVKRFFKQIFMSATYRQSANLSPEKQEADFDNSWLSRGPRFRMDAEMVRDT
ncbi:MAG: DUF1549 domain-containing protein, partial [Planctomycetales bacterium]|nr:DUF1549 domain-containing protein [Planctomycetales bacterium]